MEAEAVLKNYITERIDILPEELDSILSIFEERRFSKNELIHESGTTCSYYYFLSKGIVKSEISTDDKTSIFYFLDTPVFFTDLNSIETETPSYYSFSCITDVTILAVKSDTLRNMYTLSGNYEKLGRKIAEQLFVDYMKYIDSRLFYYPEERYLSIFETKSKLLEYVSQQDFASYLGITASAFSRLKKRIFKRHIS